MKTYTLTLTEQQLAVLDQALAELPFKLAAPLVKAINGQLTEQQAMAAADPAKAASKRKR